MFIKLFIIYIIFDMYNIGGILFRLDSNGNTVFTPINILNMIIAPLYIKEFWITKLVFSNYILLFIIIIFYNWSYNSSDSNKTNPQF